ncbi:hypothetical protein RF11_02561 [Thelohanellus kitauei]|uniref:Uncharacterized protein n=1 Tax=Thelohanellus kitauei TaxID=669202 RepID=A0A0C2J500_THEKT|nr:hypothetical protein RF11_02561 [Thelohanellus kitauei]
MMGQESSIFTTKSINLRDNPSIIADIEDITSKPSISEIENRIKSLEEEIQNLNQELTKYRLLYEGRQIYFDQIDEEIEMLRKNIKNIKVEISKNHGTIFYSAFLQTLQDIKKKLKKTKKSKRQLESEFEKLGNKISDIIQK